MGKPKYDPPTRTFPYSIPRRMNLLSVPRRYIIDTGDEMPQLTPMGVRKSALNANPTDRIKDAAWPSTRRLLILKRMYKQRFSQQRLEHIDRMIEASNATFYTKLNNNMMDLRKQDTKDIKKKRGWSESEWKKHMDYINHIAGPKPDFVPPPLSRGKSTPLEQLLPRIKELSMMPDYKTYRRLSQETWYRDPVKVPPNALKYVITDRVKKLAAHRVYPQGD